VTAPRPPSPSEPSRSPGHLDETGAPCAHHATAAVDSLLQLAMVGSRASAFHHDCASKLQGLVMALDELSELTEHGDPQLLRALEAALDSTRELHALLNVNRSLTKPPSKAPITLPELVARAAQRAGVAVQGAVPDVALEVWVPAVTHGLALAIDVAAGAGRGRSLAVGFARSAQGVELAMSTLTPVPGDASELLAIASFAITRDGGRLWCATAGDRLFVQLPVAR
jgi:hypothetical protein